MHRIVLIGGSGFVGTRLIGLLRRNPDYDVRNIDIAPSEAYPELTEYGDVRRLHDMLQALRGADTVVLLAAEHRDDVRPLSRYNTTNVGGMRHVLRAMSEHGVRRLVFFSSVAVYGLDKPEPDETATPDPANEYGRSKWKAEQVLTRWHGRHADVDVSVVRPTVIFGEGNRGNVYNLLRQIQGGRFLMVGAGRNKKSMAYVGNVAAFVVHLLSRGERGYRIYNYVDKPDFDMNGLVALVSDATGRHIPATHFPRWMGLAGGYAFDLLALVTRRRLNVSAQRVRKFCATTQFSAARALTTGFQPPYPIADALKRTLAYEFGAGAKQ
ncbi:MAG: NAD-dependent epimerase/dehydratase family protein [Bacteroidaceae bacterium]|nr:NAD-dependent epimerase/dehydratase family protein [Bacteroidaceae bacterium]